MTDHRQQSTADSPIARDAMRAKLRREKIAARLALSCETHRQASECILEHLTRLLLPRSAAVIGYCWPIRAEVDCQPLIVALLERGWRAVMPAVALVNMPMEFRLWWPDAPMTVDPFGIPVPATAAAPPPDILLVPLVAFDAAGYRLGYGGGYFDRTLAACQPRPFAIGVGFEFAAVPSILPESHDIPLDAIVTEAGVRLFNTQAFVSLPRTDQEH